VWRMSGKKEPGSSADLDQPFMERGPMLFSSLAVADCMNSLCL